MHDPQASNAQPVHPDHDTVVELLDSAPIRLPHYLAWALSSGGTLLDGLSVFMLGIALPLLERDLGLSTLEVGLLGGALVVGAAVGAWSGGRLADRVGRKTVFLLDMALLCVAAAVAAQAWTASLLILAQLLVGCAIGMDFPVSSSYVAECMPHRSRGRMMVATIACQSVGMLLGVLFALSALHLSATHHAWRLLFASEALLAGLFLVARLSLAESPRWLIGQGRNREAVRALEQLIPQNRQRLEAMADRLGDTVHHVARVPRQARPLGYATLFSPAYRRRTLLSTLPWFLMDIGTYGVGLFTAVLLGALHLGSAQPGLAARITSLVEGSGFVDLFLLLGFLCGLWAVPRFGRIRMQSFGFAGMGLGMLILLAAEFLTGSNSAHLVLVFSGFILFNLSMNMGPNSTTYILPAELFPTQLRATAGGFAAAWAKVGATLGVFALPMIKTDLGVPAVLTLMVVVSLGGLVLTRVLGVEGKGRTLEQHHTPDLP